MPQHPLGFGHAAGPQGVDDPPVAGRRLLQRARRILQRDLVAVVVEGAAHQHRHQGRHRRQLEQGDVEGLVGLEQPIFVTRLGQCLHDTHTTGKTFEVLRTQRWHRVGERLRLEFGAQLQKSLRFNRRDGRDDASSIALAQHQTFVLQPQQRLANRALAAAHGCGDLQLRQGMPVLQRRQDDLLLEGTIDRIATPGAARARRSHEFDISHGQRVCRYR
jgi:hypothetical protein